jgi:hypothetical protein
MPGQSGENRIDIYEECHQEGTIKTRSGLCDTCYHRLRRTIRRRAMLLTVTVSVTVLSYRPAIAESSPVYQTCPALYLC